MTTAEAAYCRYRSSFGILKAHARGLVRAFKRGRTYLWRREDLDDFLAGGADGDVDQPVGLRDPADGQPRGVQDTRRGMARSRQGDAGGRKRVVVRTLREGTKRDAQRLRLEMLEEAKAARSISMPRFSEYAPSLYARKVAQRELKSAKSRERWDTTLRLHLLPAFGRFAVDEITKLDIESWKTRIAKKIVRNQMSPRTPRTDGYPFYASSFGHAVDDYELERDPTLRVKDFAVDEHPTYTDENPNALTPAQASEFLARMRVRFPHFYAIVLLGFVTGLRPSTLRPLRRRGPNADVLWKDGAILVRRSNSLGDEVMNTTKTGTTYKLQVAARGDGRAPAGSCHLVVGRERRKVGMTG